jgi:hypothetical protein
MWLFHKIDQKFAPWVTLVLSIYSGQLLAGTPLFEIEIKNHLFYPAEIEIPAGVKIKLRVNNLDPTPEEFESYELNREKVISGHSKATIFIGPLAPGRYPFFGEFYPKTAQGVVVVRDD